MLEIIDQLDKQFILWFNGSNTPFWDDIMWFVSGKWEWVPFYALLLGGIIYYFRKQSMVIIPVVILLVTLADQLSVHLFKEVFERLRPCHDQEIGGLLHLVNNSCGGQFGFVSSHASNTFALAAYIAFLFRNNFVSIFMYFWAAFISLSRVYLGKHYLTDIFFGALLGILIGWLCYRLAVYLASRVFQLHCGKLNPN